jgi:hypothetical protein
VADANLKRKLVELELSGHRPSESNFFIDCDSSDKFCKVRKDMCPCLTKSRSAGYWLTSRGRPGLGDQLHTRSYQFIKHLPQGSAKQVVFGMLLSASVFVFGFVSSNCIKRAAGARASPSA